MTAGTTLCLIRHAEVEERYHRKFGGQIDMDISPRGHEQAAKLADYLQPKTFDAIYASPMKRVQQTLVPILKGRDGPPTNLPGLREVNFGDWTGLSWEEVKTKHGVSAFQWLDLLERNAVPNCESGAVFRARVEPCVQQILRDHPGQTVAVACHGGTIRMILSILLPISLPQTASFEIDYASVSLVHCLEEKTEIQLLNLTPWRDLP